MNSYGGCALFPVLQNVGDVSALLQVRERIMETLEAKARQQLLDGVAHLVAKLGGRGVAAGHDAPHLLHPPTLHGCIALVESDNLQRPRRHVVRLAGGALWLVPVDVEADLALSRQLREDVHLVVDAVVGRLPASQQRLRRGHRHGG